MKKKNSVLRSALPALLLAAGCAGFVPASAVYTAGVYEGTGRGRRGPVRVALYIEAGGIRDIEILDHEEDPLPGGAAMEELREAAVYANSAGLDAVSGATESSAGFLEAVEDALSKAALKAGKPGG